ncbi:MAG: chromosomal replication initiator protein DnaA [Oscillospiraceae bacterium]|jgi:chromosomal replication initiator protein|nr:chromosomal replication initiator protein DnaA [Oscillospiraceae bacterium]
MDEFQRLFDMVKERLRQDMQEVIYNVWLSELRPVSFEHGRAVLALAEFKRKVLEQKFMEPLHRAFEAVLGFDVEIELVSGDEPAAPPPAQPKGHEENTFETFVVGSSNKFAHAAALAVAANPGKAYNPLFIYGNSGLGKTHLLSAITHEVKKNDPSANIIFTQGEAFTNELIHYMTIKSMGAFHQKYRSAEVLIVDDVQFIAGREATQEEFFHTFNALITQGRQIVLSSDKPPKEIATLEDRLRSRFERGLIADVQPPDLETRMAIIKNKAQYTGFEISDDIVDYIARQLKNNIRQLEGAVNRLEAYVTLRGMQMNLLTAQNAISDIASEERPLPVIIEHIVEETARCYGLKSADLRSQRRNADISKARQVAMHVISQVTGLSTKAIGAEFNRDHSTVVYALREIKDELGRDTGLKKTVNDIMKNVQEG